jgi:hypothetical protein
MVGTTVSAKVAAVFSTMGAVLMIKSSAVGAGLGEAIRVKESAMVSRWQSACGD